MFTILSVFLLYDYTITFGREINVFWLRRFSGATVLFLANKYISLLNHLFDLSLFIPIHVSDKVSGVMFFVSTYTNVHPVRRRMRFHYCISQKCLLT